MASEALQPGIRFETQPPAPASVLPRMDIAALVGLAASGPLDLPVPVEDVPRFRDLFGPDPVLAWDAERQGYQRGLLGPTVEGFFRNGGRRCWVVRVAGGEAETARFRLPGLLSETGAEPARLVARSPGTWAESLRVAPLLTRAPLQARQGPGAVGGSDLAAIRAEGRGPSHPEAQLDLAEAAGVVVTGDLLELLWPDIGVLM